MEAAWTDAAGRVVLGGFFLVAALVNVLSPGGIKDHVDRLRGFRVPLPTAAFWLGTALQVVGAALVISGIHTQIGAACLIVFTVLATAIFHRFWQKTDPMQRRVSWLLFNANAAIVGGLLLLLRA